jgi:hypothetical protein
VDKVWTSIAFSGLTGQVASGEGADEHANEGTAVRE